MKYAVFSWIKDNVTEETIPIGIAVWSYEWQWHKVIFFNHPGEWSPYVLLVKEKIEYWTNLGTLPYLDKSIKTYEDGWWLHVKKLLVHQTCLSEPKLL